MKLARANIEAEVWGDPRYRHLERLLGYPPCGGDLAIARMAKVEGWQVEHYTPETPCFHVPEAVLEMLLEVDGPAASAALVRAGLAVEEPEGLRLVAATHESVGWLYRLRQRSAAGGVAKAKAQREADRAAPAAPAPAVNGNDRDNSLPVADQGQTTGMPGESPLSSLLSAPEKEEDPPSALRAESPQGEAGGAVALVLDAGKRRAGAGSRLAGSPHLAAAERLWSRQERARRRVSPKTRELDLGGKRGRERLGRVVALLAAGWTEAQLEQVVDEYEREATASPAKLRFFDGTTNWRPLNVDRTFASLDVPRADPTAMGTRGLQLVQGDPSRGRYEPGRYQQRPPAPPDRGPPPVRVSDDDKAEALEVLAEAKKRLGIVDTGEAAS